MNWLQKISQNIPQVFRVAIDFNEEVAQQLSQQVLPGISGISDSGTIAIQWFNVARDGMLMMSGPDVMAQNSITRVDYGNPEQMMQNNMAMMVRIFNQRGPAEVLQRVFQYCAIHAKRQNKKEYGNFTYFMEYTAFWQQLYYAAEKQEPQVNSVEELAQWATQIAPDLAAERQGEWGRKMMTLSPEMWQELIQGAISEIGQIYQDEGEWIVTDRNLHVPTGSTLYIILPSISDEQRVDWEDPQQRRMMEFMGNGRAFAEEERRKGWISQYGLDRIYRIRYVDDESLSDAKSEYFSKQDN